MPERGTIFNQLFVKRRPPPMQLGSSSGIGDYDAAAMFSWGGRDGTPVLIKMVSQG